MRISRITTIISFSVAGLPSASTMQSIPIFLAAGVPLEPVLALNAVVAIPDVFRTQANVTGYPTTQTIVARFAGFSNSTDSYETIDGARPGLFSENDHVEPETVGT